MPLFIDGDKFISVRRDEYDPKTLLIEVSSSGGGYEVLSVLDKETFEKLFEQKLDESLPPGGRALVSIELTGLKLRLQLFGDCSDGSSRGAATENK